MPLNYSKWDNLELSDDSDIEGHPNVDHKSLVRWKQRDIHEKRIMRNHQIQELEAQLAVEDVLLPRLRTITEEVHAAPDSLQQFSNIVEKLKTQPSSDGPQVPPDAPTEQRITYDQMILDLLMQIREGAKQKAVDNNDERLREALIAGLKFHVAKLGEEKEINSKKLEDLEMEKRKKITTEDIHEGWDSKYVPAKPAPPPVKGANALAPPKTTKTETTTTFEVLNPKSVSATDEHEPSATIADTEDEDEESATELPEMTPNLELFSKLPLRGYQQSFEFIQQHRDVYVPGAADALLVNAFSAQREGKPEYAKQCIHQSLLLQYCEKLGPDGVRVFFRKMTAGDPRAEGVFAKDVADTYAHLVSRVEISKKEEVEADLGTEQIQLVPEHEDVKVTFTVPEGPPPADLRLTGPGTENLDIEDVRRALQLQWDVYQGFPEELKKALQAQSLEEVNKVLGGMKVDQATGVVELLDKAGILSFVEGGIRDETGKNRADDADDEGDDTDVEDEEEDEDDA